MSAQQRFEAASAGLNTAVQNLIDKVQSFGVLDDAQAELKKAKADNLALVAANEDILNRMSEWAEGTIAQIETLTNS